MSDLKSRLDEIMEDMKGRVKNPLITSFILVWCYLHWILIFKAFNNNPKWTVEEEICDLSQYLNFHESWGMLVKPLLFSFASLGAFYLIAGIAQLMKNLLGERFNAWLIRWSDEGRRYQPKEKYDKLKKENERLRNQDEKLNDENLKVKTLNSQFQGDYERIKAELETTQKLRDESIAEKEKEIGTIKARNEALRVDVLRENNSRILTEAENKKLIEDNAGLSANISNLQADIMQIDNRREERYSTNMADLFPEGSRWEKRVLVGNREVISPFEVKGEYFTYDDDQIESISSFQMDKINKSVYFTFTNNPKGNFEVEVRLLITEGGFHLIGLHGNHQAVQYKRTGLIDILG